MSDVARIVLPVVFAVVGNIILPGIGGKIGWMIGSMVANAIFPIQLPTQKGPRLQDLTVQSSAFGAPIPLLYGCFRMAGNIIWSSGLIETKRTKKLGGKGGGPEQKQVTFTYRTNVAIAVCGNEITGIRRIWADSKIIYDISETANAATIAVSLGLQDKMTVYLGTESQTADPTMETWEDVGNVPAYRGVAYVVFEDFQLGDYGNRIPNFNFEVVQTGVAADVETIQIEPKSLFPWKYDPSLPPNKDPRNCLNDHEYQASGFPWRSTLEAAKDDAIANGVPEVNLSTLIGWSMSGNDKNMSPAFVVNPTDKIQLQLHFNRNDMPFEYSQYYDQFNYPSPGAEYTNHLVYENVGAMWIGGPVTGLVFLQYPFENQIRANAGTGGFNVNLNNFVPFYIPFPAWIGYCSNPSAGGNDPYGLSTMLDCQAIVEQTAGCPAACKTVNNETCLCGVSFTGMFDTHAGGTNLRFFSDNFSGNDCCPPNAGTWQSGLVYIRNNPDGIINVRRKLICPPPPCIPKCSPGPLLPIVPYPDLPENPDFCVMPDGEIESKIGWTEETGTYRQLQNYADDGVDITKYPVGPVIVTGSADDNSGFWTAAYNAAVTAGTMASGLVYNTNYPVSQTVRCNRTTVKPFLSCTYGTVGAIVQDLCERCTLDPSQIDVTDLSETIPGYAIPSVMSGRDAISPLRSYSFFDGVESGLKLKFPIRGKATVASFVYDDLGAHAADDQRPSALSINRMQEIDVPRSVRVHYSMHDKDFLVGQQESQRQITTSVNIADVSLAIAMGSTKALQISDVLLYESWANRQSYTLVVSPKYLKIEPTDAIEVVLDGRTRRMRVTSSDNAFPGPITLEAARDEGNIYVSDNAAEEDTGGAEGIELIGPSIVTLLDIPALRDADNDAGFDFVLYAPFSGWGGAAVDRSDDGGASWNTLSDFTGEAVQGHATTLLGNAAQFVYDYANTLTVVLKEGLLSSITDTTLLANGNLCALGADGRWEILQFRDATLIDVKTYTLSGAFVRGRFGTEWAMGLHQIDDLFYMLDPEEVGHIVGEVSQLNISAMFRAVSFGTLTASASTTTFTPEGVALECYAPANFTMERDLNDSEVVNFTWQRRSRVSGEWQDLVDVRQLEEFERYEIDILDTVISTVVLETITVNDAQSYAYRNAGTFYAKVYQISGKMGRGYPSSLVGPIASIDVVPTAFSFTALVDQTINTAVTSNTITVADIAGGVPISVSNGRYSLNGAAFTSTAGYCQVGDTVQVEVTTSASPKTAAIATLTIGGIVATFQATTTYVSSYLKSAYSEYSQTSVFAPAGKKGTVSFWAKFNSDGTIMNIFEQNVGGGNVGIWVTRETDNKIKILGYSGSLLLDIRTATAYPVNGVWRHFIFSWDLSNVAKRHCYVDGVSDLAVFTFTNTDLNWNNSATQRMGAHAAGQPMDMCLAHYYVNPDYMDISDSSNLQKFRTLLGKPTNLGANGSTPFGVQPPIYMKKGDPAANLGTLGNFTLLGGTAITACGTDPN